MQKEFTSFISFSLYLSLWHLHQVRGLFTSARCGEQVLSFVCVCIYNVTVSACVFAFVCDCVSEDLPADSSHAPLISTATCWLWIGTFKIKPASLKDPFGNAAIVVWSPLFTLNAVGAFLNGCFMYKILCVCSMGTCALCHHKPSTGDPLLSVGKREYTPQLDLLSLRFPSDYKMQ